MEYDVVLIRPAELYLKSEPVMRKMLKQLAHNIKVALKNSDVVFDHIVKQRLGIFIYGPEPELVINICKNIPGISILMPAAEVGTELNTLKIVSLELAKQTGLTCSKSFCVRAKRDDKSYKYTSKQVEEKVGEFVKTKLKTKVNLTKPNTTVTIEILGNKALITTTKTTGLGGLPVGVSGTVACLMTSKKKDFVAALLLLQRGCEVVPIHFRTDEKEHQKFLNKCANLEKFAQGSAIRPKNIKGKLTIKKAEKLAIEQGAKALCLGVTKLEQKHLTPISRASIPVFTPLVGLDGEQIKSYQEAIFKKGN